MRGTLAARLFFWVGIPATGVFLCIVLFSSLHSRDRVMRETEESSRHLARYHAQRIENHLGRAAIVAEMIAGEMEREPKLEEQSLRSYLGDVVGRNRHIYGSCIAFEPEAYHPGVRWFAPYFYWKDGRPEFVQLGNPTYDYFKWEWYAAPRSLLAPAWSEPYYDEGGGETVMTTYSVPFFRTGKLWGVATIDIAMSELTREVERIKIGKAGYAFVISKAGKFLAYPDPTRILKGSLFDTSPWLARRMTAGEDGFVRARGPWRDQDAWIAFVPIPTGNLSLGVVYPTHELMARAASIQFDLLMLGVIGVIGLIAMLLIVVRSISRPIADLAVAARRIAAGDLDVDIGAKPSTRELQHLTEAFQRMTADLKARIEEVRHATLTRERFAGEIAAARSIQASILPKIFPSTPKLSFHARVQPAREVGGDFFNAHFVDTEHLCIVLGDVAGKGVPAALFMTLAMTLLKAHTQGSLPPAQILARVNRELCAQNDAAMFVTVFCAILHVPSGALAYCNAGHNAPLILSPDGRVASLDHRGGPALGASEMMAYSGSKIRLQPGDTLFAYTDGVTEAVDPHGNFYGMERLMTKLREHGSLTPPDFTARMIDDVTAFAEGAPQADDISVLALRLSNASE